MRLELVLHPLSSYCHKVLIAFYENDVPFAVKHFPVLRDVKRGRVVRESTIIIEYLQTHFPGRTRLIPDDPDLAWQVRLRDRFCDNDLHAPMQKFADCAAASALFYGDRFFGPFRQTHPKALAYLDRLWHGPPTPVRSQRRSPSSICCRDRPPGCSGQRPSRPIMRATAGGSSNVPSARAGNSRTSATADTFRGHRCAETMILFDRPGRPALRI